MNFFLKFEEFLDDFLILITSILSSLLSGLTTEHPSKRAIAETQSFLLSSLPVHNERIAFF